MEKKLKKHRVPASRKLYAVVALLLCLMSSSVFAEATALVLRGKASSFEEVLRGMTDDLEGKIAFVDYVISDGATQKEVDNLIDRNGPNIIVLMGNKAIYYYYRYQISHPGMMFPPTIELAALFMDTLMPRLENATGILYEIPVVTSAVNLRSILKKTG